MPAQIRNSRSINLLPGQQLDESTTGKILKWLLSTFRVIVILVQVVVIAGFVGRVFVDARISNLNKEIDDKYALVKSYNDVETRFKTAKFKLNTYGGLQNEGNKYLALVNSISQEIPVDVQLISMQKSDSRLIITARTNQDSSMYTFTSRLNNIDKIESAQVVEITEDPNTAQLSEFIIHATVPSGT